MATETRRPRSDSVASALKTFRDAAAPPIQWPAEIEMPTDPVLAGRTLSAFEKVILGRAREDWTEASVLIAARWAKAMIASDALANQVATEGYTIASPRNPEQRIRHPALDALSQANSVCLSLSRMLQLAGGGDRKTLENNRKASQFTRSAISADDDFDVTSHSLLAR